LRMIQEAMRKRATEQSWKKVMNKTRDADELADLRKKFNDARNHYMASPSPHSIH
jgi:hypothetical protein